MYGSTRRMTAAAALLVFGIAGTSRAGYVVNVAQAGADVVASGSGTIDTAGLVSSGTQGDVTAQINPSGGLAAFGPSSPTPIAFFLGVVGPSSFGGAGTSYPSSGSGDLVGVFGIIGEMYLPADYVSGSPLTSGSAWSGQTLAGLGLTPGTYTWTWGTGADADSFTMNVAGPAVPEPSSLAMAGAGLGLVALASRRLRRDMRD